MMEETLIKENYIEEKVLINIYWANVFAVIILIGSLILFGIPFLALWYNNLKDPFQIIPDKGNLYIVLLNCIIFLFIMFIGIILHEVIHGLLFIKYSKSKFKSIKFGILPKEKLYTPYCHCKEILKINQYRIALMMPIIILGIIPTIMAIFIGNTSLLFFGSLFICAGGGDLLLFLKIIKEKNNVKIYDLPDDVGFIIFRPNKYANHT